MADVSMSLDGRNSPIRVKKILEGYSLEQKVEILAALEGYVEVPASIDEFIKSW